MTYNLDFRILLDLQNTKALKIKVLKNIDAFKRHWIHTAVLRTPVYSSLELRFENHACHAFITMQCFRNIGVPREYSCFYSTCRTSPDSRVLHSFITSSFICFAAYFRHKFALQSDIWSSILQIHSHRQTTKVTVYFRCMRFANTGVIVHSHCSPRNKLEFCRLDFHVYCYCILQMELFKQNVQMR